MREGSRDTQGPRAFAFGRNSKVGKEGLIYWETKKDHVFVYSLKTIKSKSLEKIQTFVIDR